MPKHNSGIWFMGDVIGEPWDARLTAGRISATDIRATVWAERDLVEHREHDPSRLATLRECLLSLLQDYGGDFVSASIARDAVIQVGRHPWPVTAFPSISDLLEQET